MSLKYNRWMNYLDGYCNGKNQNQDEYVRKVAENYGIEPLNVKFPWQSEILEKFRNSSNNLIILTGTAGDGKTKLCRDIVKMLDGDSFSEKDWNQKSLIQTDDRLIVKDFSALGHAEKESVIEALIEVNKNGKVDKNILIAVNDGILVDEIEKYIERPENQEDRYAKLLKEIIEDKINLGVSKEDTNNLFSLINLSNLNAKENVKAVFDAILGHPGWDKCKGCEACQDLEKISCPIYKKYTILKNHPHIIENLSNALLILQLDNQHFTIREMLNLCTNTLLASKPNDPDLHLSDSSISDTTVVCTKMKNMDENKRIDLVKDSTLEIGFFGLNLPENKRLEVRPYAEIVKLEFGDHSNFYWQDQLRNKTLRQYIPKDLALALDEKIDALGTSKKSLALIKRSLMQAYIYQKDCERAYDLQKYSHFRQYYEGIYLPLKSFESDCSDDTVSFDVYAKLIEGINRVFHARYVLDSEKIHLPDKGLGVATPLSLFHGYEIEGDNLKVKKQNYHLDLSGERVEPVLCVEDVTVSLTVALFDYLLEVINGVPGNLADPRLYKKMLVLRSRLSQRKSRSKSSRIKKPTLKVYELRDSETQNLMSKSLNIN